MKPYMSLAIGCALAAASFMAGAYESDVHYGLTFWLSAQAGLGLQQSHEVARGDELTDTGMLDAKHAIVWELCVKGIEKASLVTRSLHFRAKHVPPADPKNRPVDNSDIFAQGQSNSVIKENLHDRADHQRKFGQALHGWQDSYSHEGVSNTLALCPDQWIWSHPVDKDSVISHIADQTFKAVDKCVIAASTTYDFLLRYRQSMTLTTEPKKWEALKGPVRTFCEASTKVQKADWFKKNGVPQGDAIAKNTSLDNGGRSFFWEDNIDLGDKVPTEKLAGTTVAAYESQVPGYFPVIEEDEVPDYDQFKMEISNPPTNSTPQAQALSRGFLRAWLTSPPDKLPEAMAPYFGQSILSQDNQYITRLRRLRLKDQGNTSAANASRISGPINPDDYVIFNGDNWQTALIPVRGKDTEALVSDEGGVIFVIAILRSAPNEVLIIEAAQDFQLKEMKSLLFH